MDVLPPNAGWDLVKDALAKLREENDRFDQYCQEQFDEIEANRAELESSRAELEARRAELAEREQRLQGTDAAGNEELVQARTQLARLASVAVELADARAELVEMRKQLAEQRDVATQAEIKAAAYEKKVAKLQAENAALEAEIEEVRHTADSQKRRVAEERAEWVGELLRSALDIQSQLVGDDASDADLKVVHHEHDSHADAAASAGRIDPVLSAVMAQFETLQKGRERPAGGKSGRQGVA